MKIARAGVALLVPLLVSSTTIESHFSHVPFNEIAGAIVRTCARKTGATKEDVARIHDYAQLQRSKETKCMNACILESFGVLDGELKPVLTNIELYFSYVFEPEEHDKISEVWFSCYNKAEKNLDHCEFGDSIIRCFTHSTIEAGMKPKETWNE